MTQLEKHLSHKHSSIGRRLSLNASVRKAALEQDHEASLEEFRLRLSLAGVQLPPALLVNGDLDATLLRFLRARKFNVDAAFAMLEKSLAWRVRVQADTALERPLDPALMQLVRECRPSSYIGFDSQHHPIFLERLGKLDGPRIEKQGVADDVILDYHLREMEYMAQAVFSEASAQAGHTVDRVISIMDADGLTLGKLTGFAQRLFRLITAMDSDNYPETCHAIYIVNGGMAFGAIWRIVSPFVDKGTRDKVHVVGSGKYMQQHMFSAIGRGMTPTFLGGDLDFAAVSRHWWDRMDAVMRDRQTHPKGQQPPVVLQVPASFSSNGGHLQDAHAPHRSSFSGSFTGLRLPKLLSLGSGGLHRHSTDSEAFGTPMSNVSRMSAASGASVYFDAVDADGGTWPSPPSSLGGMAGPEALHPHGSITPVTGSSPRHMHGTGMGSPLGGGGPSTPGGSMSVGPQSCSRSQLSGFTTGHVAHGPGGVGVGRHAEMHEVEGGHHQVGGSGGAGGLQREDSMPACGCRCVIS